MDFKTVIVVLALYFIRPQDWVPGMSGMNIVKPLMLVAFFAMYSRQRGFTLGSLFRSPFDWLVMIYGVYIIYVTPDFFGTFQGVISLIAFYFVTCQALTTRKRLATYLNVWVGCLVVVGGMAVLSEYGIDLTHAHDLTHRVEETPRLVLNTYLFNNPNSLGHSVILALPTLYFALFWRRTVSRWILGAALIALCAYCVYLTKSKGAFIVGFAVVVGSQFVGRRLITQLIFLGMAVMLGGGILSQLPRMEELQNVREDEAIMGRIMAWEVARTVTKQSNTGVGWKVFNPIIVFEHEETEKATHSAYIKIGADLGPYGMFLFIALIYSGFRVLFFTRCKTDEDERSRRILFALLLGYTLSGWMIDRAYHLEYFLMLGAISSLHRRMGVETGAVEDEDDLMVDEEDSDDVGEVEQSGVAPGERVELDDVIVLSKKRKTRMDTDIQRLEDLGGSKVAEELIEEELIRMRFWRRYGLLDIMFSLGATWLVFWIWDYVLKNI